MPSEATTYDIFDCHGHCGAVHKFRLADGGSVESMIEVMDASGIGKLVFSAMLALNYDAEAGNREMIKQVERYPGRLYGYILIHPDDGEERQLAELDRYAGRPGILGVKIHPGMHNSRPAAPGYDRVYRWCVEHSYPILSHTWGEADIEDFRVITGRYPDLQVLLGHSGGPSRPALERACDLASKAKSVYLDITCSRALVGLIEWMSARAPSNRILFGSDLPFIDPRPSIGLVRHADISEELRHAVFHANAEALFAPHL